MSTVIRHTGNPYQVGRAIDRALALQGWRTVVMHAHRGGAIRIARHGENLFGDDAPVLTAGQQLTVGNGGELAIDVAVQVGA